MSDLVLCRPRSKRLIAWRIPPGMTYPSMYFQGRKNHQMGYLASFRHIGPVISWTPKWCIGSYLIFTLDDDEHWLIDNLPEERFEDLFEVIDEPSDINPRVSLKGRNTWSGSISDDDQIEDGCESGDDPNRT